jgi:hypothetical protein
MLPLLCAIVIIPLANASWIAPKINSQIRQREISQKFEFLAINTPRLAKEAKTPSIPLISRLNSVVGGKENPRIDRIMEKLAVCESGGDPTRINPNDFGSPSFGKYQFKKTTFSEMGKKYNLPATDIMNEEQQEAIVFQMLLNGEFNHWKNCYGKISK